MFTVFELDCLTLWSENLKEEVRKRVLITVLHIFYMKYRMFCIFREKMHFLKFVIY